MKTRSQLHLILVAVMVLVSLAAGIASGAAVTQAITYQGKLTNAAGNPLTGTYSVTFSLYETSSGGTALATDTHSVSAANGLFTTQIAFDPALFDGRALWLGIRVGADPEMTPRQEIRPVPYALGLRPGAVGTSLTTCPTAGSSVCPVALNVTVSNAGKIGIRVNVSGSGSAGLSLSTLDSSSPVVFAQSYGYGSPGFNIHTYNDWSEGYLAFTQGDHSNGFRTGTSGDDSSGITASTAGANSHGVIAYAFGAGSHGIHGESWYGPGVYGKSTSMDGVTGGSTDLYGVSGYSTNNAGVYGSSSNRVGVYGTGKEGGYFTTNSPGSWDHLQPGVNISTGFNYNPGILIRTHGTDSDGIFSVTYGDKSQGVYTNTQGDYSYGLMAVTDGIASPAVYGESTQDVGVYGKGKEGGYFTTNQGGTDWWTDRRPAINVATVYQYNPGMYVDTLQTNSPGVYSTTHGDNSQGFATMTYGSGSPGFNAVTAGPNSRGVDAFSVQSYGVYADTGRSDQKYGIYTPDYLYAKGTQVPAADVAEFMPVLDDVTPGTVLVIGDDGRLTPSTSAYDSRVAGIVSTDPGIFLGTKEDGNEGEALIAIAGKVPCRVDATKTPVHAGDLLTTSDRAGHAMKATDPKIGTVLGKAMGSLESGTGTIEVLVTLQ